MTKVEAISKIVLILSLCAWYSVAVKHYTKERKLELREQVRAMFQHAYAGYQQYASDYDELRPITCDGIDTWCSYSLTMIDALDTLATMGNYTEFRRVVQLLDEKLDFDKDINVSVFETNIRVVGGLLSAHLLSKQAGVPLEKGWPCKGALLRKAEDIAKRLLPAFNTSTGMPYGTVNLRHGVPKGETTITCTAGVGTLLIEFGTLSRLTGNTIYEKVALNALYSLWNRQSSIGLFGNHIDVQSGKWTALDSGIGAGIDSFLEYLVKGAIVLERPNLLQMFHKAHMALDKYLRHNDWYVWVNMNKGQVTLPIFQSLESFWPGVLSMTGDIDLAIKTIAKYASVWRKYGFLPEFYNIATGDASINRESYPLRPELVESAMYLYRATKNEFLLEVGENMLKTIEHSAKTNCGYATIRNVDTHEKENRMESFFLAETTKYLYLLFDEDNFLHNNAKDGRIVESPYGECVINSGPYIFNTEAHPIDLSALHCCHSLRDNVFDGMNRKQFNEQIFLQNPYKNTKAKLKQKYKCTANSLPDLTSNKFTTEIYDHKNVDIEKEFLNNTMILPVILQEDLTNRKLSKTLIADLRKLFASRSEHFKTNHAILDYMVHFLNSHSLELLFIDGLQIFYKDINFLLKSLIQKEFNGTISTLWQLYTLRQKYEVNMQLLNDSNLLLETNTAHLYEMQSIINENEIYKNDSHFLHRIEVLKHFYQLSLINTTSMQEFLLKIFYNQTNTRVYKLLPLLRDDEIIQIFSETKIQNSHNTILFSYANHAIDFKIRAIQELRKLQSLVNTDDIENLYQNTKSKNLQAKPSNDEENYINNDNILNVGNCIPSSVSMQKENEESLCSQPPQSRSDSASVWSTLLQKMMLQKPNVQNTNFSTLKLLQITEKSLKSYKYIHPDYNYFSCPSKRFIERFAYRHFYP